MDANREEFEQMRVEFERAFGPMPRDCTWTGFGYCATSYKCWYSNIYVERFQGFIAGQATRRAPVVPPGWRLVPIEPTDAMEQAAADYLGECVKAHGLWVAMLAAAPQSPAEQASVSIATSG
jgi:hypothetical protein